MVLFWMMASKSTPKGLSPRMPIVIGDSGFSKASCGHSTNLAKLNRNAALTLDSDNWDSWLSPAPGERSQTSPSNPISKAWNRRDWPSDLLSLLAPDLLSVDRKLMPQR